MCYIHQMFGGDKTSVIKCACGEEKCKVMIKLETWDDGGIYLWFTDKDGKETLMYLDPNTTVELIHALKNALMEVM